MNRRRCDRCAQIRAKCRCRYFYDGAKLTARPRPFGAALTALRGRKA